MKQQSSRAQRIAAKRRELRQVLVIERGSMCEVCKQEPWTDLHEILTRARGGDPTDPDNILCLCRGDHTWITEHETEARKLGLVRGRTAAEHRETFKPWL